MEIPRLLGSLPFPDTIIAFFPKKAVAPGTRWNEKELPEEDVSPGARGI
jgi:hypothetical protein